MSDKRRKYDQFTVTASQFDELQQEVFAALQENLSAVLTYHSVQHTRDVLFAATTIANKEQVSKYDAQKIRLAALFHDTGFMVTYDEHEEASCKYARKVLAQYKASTENINHICEMIMATKIPQTPLDHCSEILADADLEYLGTEDFGRISSLLFDELKNRNSSLNLTDWNQIQIKFLTQHKYFTQYCQSTKSPVKNAHLQALVRGSEG